MGNLYYFPSFWATDNLDLMKWTNLREGFTIFSKTVKVTPVSKVTPNNGTFIQRLSVFLGKCNKIRPKLAIFDPEIDPM